MSLTNKFNLAHAMCWIGLAWIGNMAAPAGFGQPNANIPPGANVYVITHIDLGATGELLEDAAKALRTFAAESKKDPGAIRFELIQQDGRLNHFTIVSVWKDRAAFEAHSAAEHTKRFREKVQPVMGSPFDERLHFLLP